MASLWTLGCISQSSNPGWAWIFILEGLITVVVGGISYFSIQDFPDTANFLSEKERMSYSWVQLT